MNLTPYTVTTAANGQTLRDYASTKRDNPHVAIFPESGLSAQEQANYLITRPSDITEIITFSPFIISDAASNCLNVLDLSESQHGVRFGDSVNRVTLRLWRRSTIGASGQAFIEDVRARVNAASSADELNGLTEILDHFGDSVERHILMTSILKKIDSIKNAND